MDCILIDISLLVTLGKTKEPYNHPGVCLSVYNLNGRLKDIDI